MPIPPGDSMPVDTSKRNVPADSNGGRVTKDTIKTPLAHAELPPMTEIGGVYHWDRRTIFSTGARTLADLLDRIPGVAGFRGGWLGGPSVAAYMGDVARVRLFYDGLELDAMNPRYSGAQELTSIELWTLQDLVVERGAGELRVYMRSWSSERTTPYTRADISTGDLGVNSYRGFFGRRYDGGAVLQTGGEYTNQSDRRIGDADGLSLLARTGWAAGHWSADAYVLRTRHSHSRLTSVPELNDQVPGVPLSSLEWTDTYAYLRGGYGDPDHGLWAQLVAGTVGFKESSAQVASSEATSLHLPSDSVDTIASRSQYVASAGLTKWGVRFSATERVRVYSGRTVNSPSTRAAFDHGPLTISGLAERDGAQSIDHVDVLARIQPVSFIALSGAASQRSPFGVRTGLAPELTTRSARAEAALRLGRTWLGGGALFRDSTYEAPATEFFAGRSARGVLGGQAYGHYALMRGAIYRGLGFEGWAIRWNTDTAYLRPRYQSFERLGFQSNWLRKFPSGNFGITTAVTHEYRAKVKFPIGDAVFVAPQSHVLGFLLELRILQADVSYQFRNFLGTRYQLVPGFSQPRQSQVYGVRWEFWN